MPTPRVLCRGWSPRRGVQYACYLPGRVIQEGEPGGETLDGWQCRICRAQEERVRKAATFRAKRTAEDDRRKGKTFGEAPEGQDVFKGMR